MNVSQPLNRAQGAMTLTVNEPTSLDDRIKLTNTHCEESRVFAADYYRMNKDGTYHFDCKETPGIYQALGDAVKLNLADRSITTVIVMIGPPASGKTTCSEKIFNEKPIVTIRKGKTIVIDNTHTIKNTIIIEGTYTMNHDRQKIIKTIRAVRKDVKIQASVMMTGLDDCQARNAERIKKHGNKVAKVPNPTIERMHNSLHGKDPKHSFPSIKEGFSGVTIVNADGAIQESTV